MIKMNLQHLPKKIGSSRNGRDDSESKHLGVKEKRTVSSYWLVTF